jgi:hypothetical protein
MFSVRGREAHVGRGADAYSRTVRRGALVCGLRLRLYGSNV